MPSTFHQVIYLGRFSDADTDELTYAIEDTSVYEQNFGSAGDPLKNHVIEAEFKDDDFSGFIETDNVGGWPDNAVTYDIGSGSETHEVDSLIVGTVEVTSMDGTTVTYSNVVMFQMTNGDLFLGNSDFAGTDIETGTGGIQSVNVVSVDESDYTGLMQLNLQTFVCFEASTLIETPSGGVAAKTLRVGDLVNTLDAGPRPLAWVGRRRVKTGNAGQPIRISRGALGPCFPLKDLVVSPQHRILVSSRIAARIFGTPQVFVAAKHLVGLPGIVHDGAAQVTYVHLLFKNHHVLQANGAFAESLFAGDEMFKTLSLRDRLDVAKAGLCATRPTPARPFAVGQRRDQMLMRHARHAKPLLQLPPQSTIEPAASAG